MRLFIVVFLACGLAYAGAKRDAEETLCGERVAELVERSIWPGRRPLILPPGGKRHLIGSLVKTEKGKHLLAIGGYRTRHHHLHLALDVAIEEENWGRMSYLWLGEMEVENTLRFEAVGEFRRAIPVAGFWATDLHSLAGNFNEAHLLTNVLQERYRTLLHPKFQSLTYDDAVKLGELHLQKRLRKYLKEFDRLKASAKIPERETYRHYIGNRIQGLLSAIAHILRPDNTDPKDAKLTAIRATFEPALSLESMYLYLTWLENDGVQHASIGPMKELLKKYDKDEKLSMNEWLTFGQAGSRLLSYVFGARTQKVSLEDWMAFGGISSDFLDLAHQLNDDAASAGEAQIIVLDPP